MMNLDLKPLKVLLVVASPVHRCCLLSAPAGTFTWRRVCLCSAHNDHRPTPGARRLCTVFGLVHCPLGTE